MWYVGGWRESLYILNMKMTFLIFYTESEGSIFFVKHFFDHPDHLPFPFRLKKQEFNHVGGHVMVEYVRIIWMLVSFDENEKCFQLLPNLHLLMNIPSKGQCAYMN